MEATAESSFVLKMKMRRAEGHAWKEIRWFFGTMRGRVPRKASALEWQARAARKIRRWLDELPTFHTGAFELRYAPRTWPAPLVKRFGDIVGLVVRLESARHPGDGNVTVDELEKASARRLEAMLTDGRSASLLYDLEYRAYWHLRAALTAYLKVRGLGRSALPIEVRRKLRAERDIGARR